MIDTVTSLTEERKDTPLDMELDFSGDWQEQLKLEMYIEHIVETKLCEYYDNEGEYFRDVIRIIEDIACNINDHGEKKGYLYMEVEYDAIAVQHISHFVIGDFGPGIKTKAGSYENYFMEGWTTEDTSKTQRNNGMGGSVVKDLSANCKMHLVLYDNEEVHIINEPTGFTGYKQF